MDDAEADDYLEALNSCQPTAPLPVATEEEIGKTKAWAESKLLSSQDKLSSNPLGKYFLEKFCDANGCKPSDDVIEKFKESDECKKFIKYLNFTKKKATFDDFEIMLPLGRGALGMVEATRRKSTGAVYAMKRMCKRMIKEKKCKKFCQMERDILETLNSPFVVDIVYAFQTEDYIFIIMEVIAGGSLEYNIHKHDGFSEDECKFYASEVALGLNYLHENGVVYRDMKSENILLDLQGHVHISDFGISIFLKKGKAFRQKIGTKGWWAPEVIQKEKSTHLCDWFGYGVLLYQMVSNKCIFMDTAKEDNTNPDKLSCKWDPPFDDLDVSDDMKDILRKLLEKDPKKRLGAKSFDEIKNHKWFDGLDWDAMQRREIDPPIVPSNEEANTAHNDDLKGDFEMPNIDLQGSDLIYDEWDFQNSKHVGMEVVKMLEHDAELIPAKPAPVKSGNGGCCIVQ